MAQIDVSSSRCANLLMMIRRLIMLTGNTAVPSCKLKLDYPGKFQMPRSLVDIVARRQCTLVIEETSPAPTVRRQSSSINSLLRLGSPTLKRD